MKKVNRELYGSMLVFAVILVTVLIACPAIEPTVARAKSPAATTVVKSGDIGGWVKLEDGTKVFVPGETQIRLNNEDPYPKDKDGEPIFYTTTVGNPD